MGRQSRNDFIGGKGTPQERKKRHARILLTFKEDNKLTQKTTDHFVDCVNFFARNIVDECANLFLDRLKKRGVDGDEIVREVKDDLEPLQKPFAGLETAWSQAAYFEEVFHSVVRLHKIDNFVCHLVLFRKVVGIKKYMYSFTDRFEDGISNEDKADKEERSCRFHATAFCYM